MSGLTTMREIDYYKILEISPSANLKDIRAAYRRLARKYHPDKSKASDATLRMQEINEANAVLSDPGKRAEFDRERLDRIRHTKEAQREAEHERQREAQSSKQREKQEDARRSEEQRRAKDERKQKTQTAEQTERQKETQHSSKQPFGRTLRLTLTPNVTMDFVYVPAGEFLMGSVTDCHDAERREKPQHKVYVDEYFIGRYPVTMAQFAAFVQKTGYQCKASVNVKNKINHPVTNVSWNDATAFCEWVSKQTGMKVRLPSEAEWEKAARGTDGNEWPWGDKFDKSRCNSVEDGKKGTTPIGAYSPQGDGPYGAADMAGNVWEWCHSIHRPYPYQMNDGRESETDPRARVMRGGAWGFDKNCARGAYRNFSRPDKGYPRVGIRLAVSPDVHL